MKTFQLIFVFSLMAFMMSCGGKQEQSLTQKDNDAIEKYLDENVMNPEFGGKVFSASEIFETSDDKIYLWAYLQEYYKKDNALQTGSGWSVPIVLSVECSTEGLKILNHKVPGDGENYSNDIKSMFPEDIQQKIFDFSGTESIPKLEKNSKERAEKYFSL
ncbi:MAG: hypothetical protein V1904_08605 [Bacteroidota bacterium]